MKKQEVYLKNQISKLFLELEQLQQKVFYVQRAEQECDVTSPPIDSLIEESEQVKAFHDFMIKSLHNQIICYLDMNHLNRYLDIFIEKFGSTPNVDLAYNGINFDSYTGEIHNDFLREIHLFLLPFKWFNDDLGAKVTGIKYLETILKNTATTIHCMGKTPTSEPEVYKAVKVVLESIFSSSKNAGSNFLKTAKQYKPDILIPELGAVIEYKYAKDETKLKATIEEIAADVKGYTGDQDYNIFYAVFYVTKDFWGIPKFQQVWDDNKFPKNWRAFYIVGNSS